MPEEKKQSPTIEKGKIKLFVDGMIVYMKNPKESKKNLEPVSKFSKVSE